MVRPFFVAVALAAALAVRAAPAGAQVDAAIEVAFARREATGRGMPLLPARSAFAATGLLPVTLRLARGLRADEVAALRALGFEPGARLASGAIDARCGREALAWLAARGLLARASLAVSPPRPVQPLDLARRELGLAGGLEAARALGDAQLSGKGVVVGDLDSVIDVFHPAFFSADGARPWVDVDGDGRLTPGVDGVDGDGDGGIAPGEVLRLLDGRAKGYYASAGAIAGTDNGGFDPRHDALFLDADGDGRRGCGAAFGAALCEPTFVADDVDGDGLVRPGERVFALGASKIRRVLHGGQVFERGAGLAALSPRVEGPGDADHGTLALGSLVGGQPGLGRFVGVAPGADVVLATLDPDDAPLTSKFSWLHDQGADVILSEVSYWGATPTDGSSEVELLLASLVDAGTLVVVPAGNLASSGKQLRLSAAPGEVVSDTIELTSGEPRRLWMSATWRQGGASFEGALVLPGGGAVELTESQPAWSAPGGWSGVVVRGTTALGAGYALLAIERDEPLPDGMKIELRWAHDEPVVASLFLVDDGSGWSGGLRFSKGGASGSATPPAMARGALVVGAYGLHVGQGYASYGGDEAGALRPFSGRGPDLWGNGLVSLAAPDNPVAAFPDVYDASGRGQGTTMRLSEFSGTSGAGALAAGLAALSLEARPGLRGAKLRDALVAEALRDADVEAGDASGWGAGKARFFQAPAAPAVPSVALQAPASAAPGQPVELLPLVSEGALVRWDVGYDGVWDGAWGPPGARSLTMPDGTLDVKLEALSPGGWTRAASARIRAASEAPAGEGGGGGAAPVKADGLVRDDSAPAGARGAGPGGCACGLAAGSEGPGGAALALAALVALARRRRFGVG